MSCSSVQRCDQQPPEWGEKPSLAPLLQGSKCPSDQFSRSGHTEPRTGLCNKQLKAKVYKNAVLKGWEHGQFTLKLCNSCSAQGWQMLPPLLRDGEREIKCVSCFYCVMLLSNLWKISDIKRNLWGECEQAFWNGIIQKKNVEGILKYPERYTTLTEQGERKITADRKLVLCSSSIVK